MIDPDKLTGRLGNRMFQIAYLYSQVKDGTIPDWYLQDPKYFQKYDKEIKELFSDGIGYLPYVAIHLRRGDYVDNPFYVDLAKTGYYIDATNLFPNRKFIVFTDDVEFAKTYFEGDKFTFDDSPTAIEALNKMASCDGIITANSSLSFWAAYLSPNRGKIVAPNQEKWFTDGQKRIDCPQHWVLI